MPAAPASRQARAFLSVMPPKARTGILCRQASRSPSRPAGLAPGTSFFSKTGAKTAKSALSEAARSTSAAEWQETLTSGWAGGVGCVQIFRTSDGEISSARKCTPSAPHAAATSVRELIRTRVAGSRFSVPDREFSRMIRTAVWARASSSRVERSFSRN